MNSYEKYCWEAECHKRLVTDLPNKIALKVEDKTLLASAKRKATWSAIGLQFPVVVGLMYLADRKISNLPTNKKVGLYMIGFSTYYYFHKLSRAWAWHYAFKDVEPFIEQTFASLSEEDLMALKGKAPPS
jgi:hypothetical protein